VVRICHFTSEEIVPRGLEQVFASFANAHNLELLTPAWLHFEILTRGPLEMREGTKIDYGLKLHGFPLHTPFEGMSITLIHAYLKLKGRSV
jgi:ligand-binding SRPBCC domain-containing protein